MAENNQINQGQADQKTDVTLRGVTAGSKIHIEEPAKTKKRRVRKPKVVSVIGQTDDVLLEQASGFTNFIREYAVVGLAVGFIVGQQANGVVKQLVASFVEPLLKMWFGQGLEDRVAIIHHHGQPVKLPWGSFVYLLIEFFIVLIVIYAVVKLFRLDKLQKPKVEDKK